MKRLFMILTLFAFVATACSESPETNQNNNQPSTPTTTITLGRDNISVGSGNGISSISYDIENPVEGLNVEVTADVDWIHSFTYTDTKIGFSINATDLYEERTGVITVTYGEASDSVTVTQEAKQMPKEIEVTAPFLIGEYYGDYAGANYNYYIAFSSSDYDANNPLYAPGWKYFLDIYASDLPADYNNIRIPNGVYTLTANGGVANSLFGKFSIYKEYDNSGFEIDERVFEEATLTVTDDMVKLEVVFEDSNDKYIVTYSGDYTIIDKRNVAGGVN
jgi:hypothetical protein